MPTSFTCSEKPVGENRFTITLSGTIEIDITRGNLGSPLLGQWWFLTRVDLAGTSSDYRVGPLRSPGAEESRVAAFVKLTDGTSILVSPSYQQDGRLTVTADHLERNLAEVVQNRQRPTLVRHEDGLQLHVPLKLLPNDQQITLPIQLLGGGKSIESTARLVTAPASSAAPERAVLTAELPAIPRQQRWQVALGPRQQPVPLKITLSPTFRGWSVKDLKQNQRRLLPARIYRGLRRRAGRLARALGLR